MLPSYSQSITLHGNHITLVPLTQKHCVELQEAVKDGEIWKLWYTRVPTPKQMENEIERRLNLQTQGDMLPFVVIDNKTQKAVGMTTYCNIENANKRLDIGWTWYKRSVQRTAFNTECKLILLTHAFEELKCIAVIFRVHSFNQPSRKAVERLGAKLDGILRNDLIMPDGSIRDTCVYSILPHEWPNIKTNLEYKLKQHDIIEI